MGYYIACFLILFLPKPLSAYSQNYSVAKVILLKGKVHWQKSGEINKKSLAHGQTLNNGDIVVTGRGSFVKLIFIDHSKVIVGPHSTLRIELFEGENDPGMVQLLKGQLRSIVEKKKESSQNKFFIKTKKAALAVRGTDFQVSFNGEETQLYVSKGEVAMAALDFFAFENANKSDLDDLFKGDQVQQVLAGEYVALNEQKKFIGPFKLEPDQAPQLAYKDLPVESEEEEIYDYGVYRKGQTIEEIVEIVTRRAHDQAKKASRRGEKDKGLR